MVADKIRFAAENKQRKAIIRETPFRNWKTPSYVMEPWEVDLHDTLIANGYALSLHEEIRSNTIDRGLVIDFDFMTRPIPEPLETGYFIDAPVQGLAYTTTSGLSGLTGVDGSFQYRSSDRVTFKHVNFIIAENVLVPSDKKVTPMDLYSLPRTSTREARVMKLAQYLLTVNTASDTAVIVLNQTPVLGLSSILTDSTIDIEMAIGRPLVSDRTSQTHLNDTVTSVFELTPDPIILTIVTESGDVLTTEDSSPLFFELPTDPVIVTIVTNSGDTLTTLTTEEPNPLILE
jgi:hypothetical protein